MFAERLNQIISGKKSLLCIGLDTDMEHIPKILLSELDPLFSFNREIIEATADFASAYKINIAFYESLGMPGWELLEKTLAIMPREVVVIADAKRADIENSSRKYAETFFKSYDFDGITASPYMGLDSLIPFLEFEDKGIFILCLTSNSGSQDFQFLKVDGEPLYLKVARKVVEWNFNYGNCGLVVGGTHTIEISKIRDIAPDLPFLVPGIGAQGGNLDYVVKFATDKKGLSTLINASRSVVYANSDHNFAESARERAKHLRDHINVILSVHKDPGLIDMN
jgi:orotidine-5'-phosphate decarboxylase